jgi:tetratricopeptide (TPR) repeat protein
MKHIFKISVQLIILLSFSTAILSAQTLKEAIKLSDNEQYESASSIFDKLIKAEPINGDNYFYAGENFFGMENADSAKIMFQKGIDVAPENPLNYVGIGTVLWYKNDTSAKSFFSKALHLSKSKNATVLLKISEVYIKADKKNISEAFILLNTAAKKEPKNPEVYILMGDAFLAQDNGSQAIVYYEKATTLDTNSTKALLRTGQLYGRARNFPLSFEYYQKANAIDSAFAPAYREKAEFYYNAQQFEKAIDQYKKYLQINNNLSARIRYASFLFLNKQYANAISEIQEIQKHDSSKVVLYRLLAYSYFETGDYPNGLLNINKFFDRVEKSKVKVLPSDYQYQGKLLSKTGQDSLAIITLTRAVELDSTQIELYNEIGTLNYKLKKYPQAIAAFEKRIQLRNGGSANDFNALGRAFYYNKEYQKSDSVFAKLIEGKPELPVGYFWRARSNSKLDPETKTFAAKPHYEAFIEKAQSDVAKNKKDLIEAYSYMGYYFAANKNYPSAKNIYTKVLELDPENAAAKAFIASPQGK